MQPSPLRRVDIHLAAMRPAARWIMAEEPEKSAAAAELGLKGGAARAKSMSPEKRAEIARKAAASRWKK